MLFPCESILLGGCDDPALLHEAGGAVVIVGGYAQYRGHDSKKHIDERGHHRALRQDDESSEEKENEDQREQPELLRKSQNSFRKDISELPVQGGPNVAVPFDPIRLR